MSLKSACFVLFILILFFNTEAFSKNSTRTRRHRKSHVHGQASINFVTDDKKVLVELKMPAHDAVGFEQTPSTPEQKKAVEEAVKRLSKPFSILSFSKKANCRVHGTPEVDTALQKTENHDHDHSHHESPHSKDHAEFEAKYSFLCENMESLKNVDLLLFKKFPNLQEVKAQGVIKDHPFSERLTPSSHNFIFGR